MSGTWAAASNKKRKSEGYWEEERDMVVQLMMGRPLHHRLDVNRPPPASPAAAATTPPPLHAPPFHPPQSKPAACTSSSPTTAPTTTLDLLGFPPPQLPLLCDHPPTSSCSFDLDSHSPLPSGWEKCLDLQTGSIYYLNRITGLSTSCDPRKATTSSGNWPTSPSSSSDLTFEANVPMPSSSKPNPTTIIEGPHYESTNLDLTLSLKPSSPSLRPNSLNHSLIHDPKSDPTHNLRSLISPQGLLNNQSSPSFNSSSHFKAPFALPTCTSSTASSTSSSSSSSTLFFQDLSVHKDMGSLGSSMSSKESLNGISRAISNNLNMSARETHSSSPTSKNFSVNGNAKPIISDTHCNAIASSPMITVGCANCLMFVMLPRSCSPKCPRCGASIDSDLPQPPSSINKPKLAFSLMY